MLPWSPEHRVFAYDTYVKNAESVTETQRPLQAKIQHRSSRYQWFQQDGATAIQRERLTLESGFKVVLVNMAIICQT